MYYIVTLKLTFKKSCFLDSDIFSKGDICIKTKYFIASNFRICYRDLMNFLDNESDEGILKDCDTEILSIIKVGDKI